MLFILHKNEYLHYDMMYTTTCFCLLMTLCCSCIKTNQEQSSFRISKHAYAANNDSIAQSLELSLLDSLHTQFILKVEHKYMDTIDSYMGSAVSKDQIHYSHKRTDCNIDFTLTGLRQDTAYITRCECLELTVKPSFMQMRTDTLEATVYR